MPWYSADGRYMCGIDVEEKKATAWVLDTRTGRILRRKRVKAVDWYDADWRRGAFVISEGFRKNKPLAVLKP